MICSPAAALDRRVEAEVRLEVVERGYLAGGEGAQVVGLEDVPVAGLDRRPEERASARACSGSAPFARGRPRGTGRGRRIRRDQRATAQERLAEHRRPLDLEQESSAEPRTCQMHVDLVDVLRAGLADTWRARAQLAIVQPRRPGRRPRTGRTCSRLAIQTRRPEPVAQVRRGQRRARCARASAAAGRPR